MVQTGVGQQVDDIPGARRGGLLERLSWVQAGRREGTNERLRHASRCSEQYSNQVPSKYESILIGTSALLVELILWLGMFMVRYVYFQYC